MSVFGVVGYHISSFTRTTALDGEQDWCYRRLVPLGVEESENHGQSVTGVVDHKKDGLIFSPSCSSSSRRAFRLGPWWEVPPKMSSPCRRYLGIRRLAFLNPCSETAVSTSTSTTTRHQSVCAARFRGPLPERTIFRSRGRFFE